MITKIGETYYLHRASKASLQIGFKNIEITPDDKIRLVISDNEIVFTKTLTGLSGKIIPIDLDETETDLPYGNYNFHIEIIGKIKTHEEKLKVIEEKYSEYYIDPIESALIGKLNAPNIFVDSTGLVVENGKLTIKDELGQNVVTSKGLKTVIQYTSSGDLSGYQRVGWWSGVGSDIIKMGASFFFYIPDDLIIEEAIIHLRSMPTYKTGFSFANGFYHARNLRLYRSSEPESAYINYPYLSSYDVRSGAGSMQDISSAIGGAWSPSGQKIAEITGDIKNHISVGNNFLVLETTETTANHRYGSGAKLELIVKGYMKGGI